MNNRYIGAVILLPILALFFLGGWWLKFIVVTLSFRALYEYYFVVSKKGHKPLGLVGYLTLALYYASVFILEDPLSHLGVLLALALAFGFLYMIFQEETTLVDVGITLMGILYAGVLFSLILLLSQKDGGQVYVYLVFISSWVCDTLAYRTGRMFGKHKLIERVSPKKTVEGAVGGLFGGALGAVLLGYLWPATLSVALIHFLIMGFLGAFFGQLGDLAASSIKRYAGEKDYPKLIPGHGGVLDRFDSILFVALVVYVYTSYLL